MELPQIPKRVCGECNACCKPFTIEEVGKHDGGWCSKCDIGHGCTIYNDRPLACRQFTCAWLNGLGNDNLRPDRFGIMILVENFMLGTRRVDIVYLWETIPGTIELPIIQKMIEDNKNVGNVVQYSCMVGDSSYQSKGSVRKCFFSKNEFKAIQEHINNMKRLQ